MAVSMVWMKVTSSAFSAENHKKVLTENKKLYIISIVVTQVGKCKWPGSLVG